MKTKQTRILCIALLLALLCSLVADAAGSTQKPTHRLTQWLTANLSVSDADAEIDTYLDWSVFALARNGCTELNAAYRAYIIEAVPKNADMLYLNDYARIALAVMAVGLDAADVGGVNLIRCIEQCDFSQEAYTASLAYALIALDAANSICTQARETLKTLLLSAQRTDGGFNAYVRADRSMYWTLDGETDSTGIVLQALAPYRSETAAAEMIRNAKVFLHLNQMQDGGFGAFGAGSAESTAMILTGLCLIGEDVTSTAYSVDGHTMLDALMTYVNSDGGGRCWDGSSNVMTTYEMLIGLSAYDRVSTGKIGLFDMTCLSPRCTGVEHRPFFAAHPLLGRIVCRLVSAFCRLIGKPYYCCRHEM